jgi:GWxTD domain-containing protein
MIWRCFCLGLFLLGVTVFGGESLCIQQPEVGSGSLTRIQQDSLAKTKEMPKVYRKWLDEDVFWIIGPEERAAFLKLSDNEERDQFVEQFWSQRNPTPGAATNPFKQEHYRRIAYSNMHFQSQSLPGWRTDRGGVYILHGRPDEIEQHPNGGTYQRPEALGGPRSESYPFEVWRYHYLEGIGKDIELEFGDPCRCGEYKLIEDFRDHLIHVPQDR